MRLQKMPMSLPLSKVATATTDSVVSDPVQSNHLMCVQRLGYRNVGHGATSATVLKRGHGKDVLISETVTLADSVIYNDPYPEYFTEGEQLVITFVGVTVGDVMEAYALGWISPFIDTEDG